MPCAWRRYAPGNCRSKRQSYCLNARGLKMDGTRADGSTLHSKDGKPIYSAFFQQSSFGSFAIANERYAVKVRDDVPLAHVAALACGGQTGAGAVLNVLKPSPGDSLVVFGVGSVGLSALMAARIAGCDPIIAVEDMVAFVAENSERRELRTPVGMDEEKKIQATLLLDLQAVFGFVSLLDDRLYEQPGTATFKILLQVHLSSAASSLV